MILSDEVWSDIVYRPHTHVCMASLDGDVAAGVCHNAYWDGWRR